MRRFLGVILIGIAVLSALGQGPSPKYQPGTIMAVTAHKSPGQPDTDVTQYEVSVKVGNTTYVVLYTPPNGSDTVEHALGDDLLVLVGSNTLIFNVPASGKIEAPILSRATPPAQGLDLSKACGQYSSLKLHLSENLALSEEQQAQIMPILSQEAGEVGEICFIRALSRGDKLNQYENFVRASDEKVKPLLSATQLQELQDLRKEQEQYLKKMIAEQKSSQHDQMQERIAVHQ